MTIADGVWERLARSNPTRRKNRESAFDRLAAEFYWLIGSCWLVVLCIWLAAELLARLCRNTWFCFLYLLRLIVAWRWVFVALAVALLGWMVLIEIRTSHFQAAYFSRLDREMSFSVQPGPSSVIRFPTSGPYDERLGYAGLPGFLSSLSRHHFAVDSAARWSPRLDRFVADGAYPIYPEKEHAGLRIFDRRRAEIYEASVPQHGYRDFAEIPEVVVNSLLFIEDRYLFDPRAPERNAAVEWKRFLLAAAGRIVGILMPQLKAGGASTLATQIEKFRHSPGGKTPGIGGKLTQMLTASARIYANGPNTIERRRQVVTTYLNATPLSSRPGYGEVIGIPDALWVWFGTDLTEANQVLAGTPQNDAEWARKGEIYRQVLSLLLADRGPTYYLTANRAALGTLADRHLRLLCEAGIIDTALRDAALGAPLRFRDKPPPIAAVSFVRQKATQEVRARLMRLLGLPDLYALDRLDLTAETTIDTATQARVAGVLQRLSDPAFLRDRGMIGHQLLGNEDPTRVTYSFVLYERGADRNYLRIHADSLNEPFDINSGGKLMLGSTAKLRTLATYLGVIEQLHSRLASLPPRQLTALAASAPDPLTGWAAAYLARSSDRRLQPMLDAALERHYSGSPGSSFTGGGMQSFGNFETWEDRTNPTVLDAFEHSINLAFVRLLQDITVYYGAAASKRLLPLLANPDDPRREEYLRRFADEDGRRYLDRFYKDYRGLSPDQSLALLASRTRAMPRRLGAAYLSVRPDATFANFRDFINAHLAKGALADEPLWDIYRDVSPERLSLADRGYVAGVHPIELWLVNYLQEHPGASRAEIIEASGPVRQEVYRWLFDGSVHKQDLRIRTLLEQDAFSRIWQVWRSQGYPFAHLVPSVGTAIGASGDRPDALAELIGIILNDGVRRPTVDIERLSFAEDTPYETNLAVAKEPERVMSTEVAQTLRRALTGVVAQGTASRLRGAYLGADKAPLLVGGKTGTGDNRFDHFTASGGITSSRVVDRTATFVFFLSDRFFGTVTAYVPGAGAAHYQFTSALAVQLLKAMQPELQPLLDAPAGAPAPSPLLANRN